MFSYVRNVALSPIWMMQILTQAKSFSRNPFLPYTGLDLGSQGPLKNRKPVVSWAFLVTVERLGLGRSVWRERKGVAAFDVN